jgi:hypothetical protein
LFSSGWASTLRSVSLNSPHPLCLNSSQQAGITPAETLATATILPAKLVGQEKNTGSISVGKIADLALFQGDPPQRLSDLRHTRLVMLAGRLLDADVLREVAGFSGRPKAVHPICKQAALRSFPRMRNIQFVRQPKTTAAFHITAPHWPSQSMAIPQAINPCLHFYVLGITINIVSPPISTVRFCNLSSARSSVPTYAPVPLRSLPSLAVSRESLWHPITSALALAILT